MGPSTDTVLKIAVLGQSIEAGHTEKQRPAITQRAPKLAQYAKRVGEVFDHVVQDDKRETSILGQRHKAMVSKERQVH